MAYLQLHTRRLQGWWPESPAAALAETEGQRFSSTSLQAAASRGARRSDCEGTKGSCWRLSFTTARKFSDSLCRASAGRYIVEFELFATSFSQQDGHTRSQPQVGVCTALGRQESKSMRGCGCLLRTNRRIHYSLPWWPFIVGINLHWVTVIRPAGTGAGRWPCQADDRNEQHRLVIPRTWTNPVVGPAGIGSKPGLTHP
jgi:hypothetical protein